MNIWDWEYVWEVAPALAVALIPTAVLTIIGAGIALLLGLLLASFRLSRSLPLNIFGNIVSGFMRSVPALVLVYFVFFGLAELGMILTAFGTAVAVLSIYYCGYMSDAIRASVLAVPRPILESCVVLNLSHFRSWTRILIPLGLSAALPSIVNYFILAYKQTAVFVAIGLPILLGEAQRLGYESFRYLEVYTLSAVLYIVSTLPIIWLLRRLESRNVFG